MNEKVLCEVMKARVRHEINNQGKIREKYIFMKHDKKGFHS